MVDLKGPAPENMKPGETYRVVQSEKALSLERIGTEDRDVRGAYRRHRKLAEKIRAIPVELELSDQVYELLSFLCEETDIEFGSMCSQLVDEGLHKLMDNHEEFGKLISSSLKMNFSLHDWLRKDEW